PVRRPAAHPRCLCRGPGASAAGAPGGAAGAAAARAWLLARLRPADEPEAAPGVHRPGADEPAAGRAAPGPAPADDGRGLRRDRPAAGAAPGPGAAGADARPVAADHQPDPQGPRGARRRAPDLRRNRDRRPRDFAPGRRHRLRLRLSWVQALCQYPLSRIVSMSSILRRLLPLLLLALACAAVRAEPLPLLDLRRADLDAPPPVALLEDPGERLALHQARARLSEQGRELRHIPSLGWSDSAWWLGLRLQGRPGAHYYLWLDHAYLDDVQLWVFVDGQLQLHRQLGDRLPFARRDEPLRAFLMPLPALGPGEQEVILRVRSTSSVSLPLRLVPAEAKDRLLAGTWLNNGLIVGALLVMGLFHLLKFAIAPDRRLGYYCATILSVAWYSAAIND